MTESTEPTRGTAHFRISGKDFTRLVRQRMLDDDPGAAYCLASSLISDDPTQSVSDVAQRLCDGLIKLVGNESDMKLEECKAKGYKAKLTWLFAGRIRIRGKWYQPAAYVTDMGPNDMKNIHGMSTVRRQGSDSRGIPNRAWHYCGMDDIVVDEVSHKDKDHVEREVIFEQCGERPHWHETPSTPREALEQYLAAGRKLQERSHSKLYGKDPGPLWGDGYPGRAWKRDEPPPPAGGPNAVAQKRWSEEDEVHDREERKQKREAEEEARYAEEEASRLRRVADLRELILKQAGDDLLELTWPASEDGKEPGGTTKVPRAPFMIWAFARLKWLRIKLPTWKTISPSGMKMVNDDPNHTDWCIGAGFDPHDRRLYWGGTLAKAASELSGRIQEEADDRNQAEDEKVTTLVTGAIATGAIHHGKPNKASPKGSIVVLPNLHPKYLKAVADAAAVITEEGGETAHLAQVGRERSLPIVRRPDACDYFTDGDVVAVDAEGRTVKIIKLMINEPDEEEDDDF